MTGLDHRGWARNRMTLPVTAALAAAGLVALALGTPAAATDTTRTAGAQGAHPATASAPVRFGLFQAANNLDYSFPVAPEYAVQYYGWPEKFQVAQVKAAWKKGIESFLVLNSCGNPCDMATSTPLKAIADNKYYSYLKAFGESIRAFGHPVLLTFDHEMNAPGYPWSTGTDDGKPTGVTPALWKSAWDHVASVVSKFAGKYVTFVWAPEVETYAASFAPYWPGKAGTYGYKVGFQGLDGYLAGKNATWANTFAKSLAAMRKLGGNHYQFELSDTGVYASDSDAGAQIANLVSNARAALGAKGFLIYFDAGRVAMTGAMKADFVKDIR